MEYSYPDRNQLKWVAAGTMLLDHIGALFIHPEKQWLLYFFVRGIGRISFPLFAYLLVQGFVCTGNYKQYLKRVGVFALLSEIPFDLVFSGAWINPGAQNVMLTLFISLVVLYYLREWEEEPFWKKLLIISEGAAVAWILRSDYSWFGVVLVAVLYLCRDQISLYYTPPESEKKGVRYFFYVFYPAHLLILRILAVFAA